MNHYNFLLLIQFNSDIETTKITIKADTVREAWTKVHSYFYKNIKKSSNRFLYQVTILNDYLDAGVIE